MARVERKSACLWHAYNALKEPESDEVKKPKLKVLTHNIANCLGLVRKEEKLDNYEEDSLTYLSYMGFLRSELFGNIRQTGENATSSALEKVDEVCWFVCCQKFMNRAPVVLDNDNMFILWKIFNTLAEVESDGMAIVPVVVHTEEVEMLISQFCTTVGTTFDLNEFKNSIPETGEFSFEQTLNYFETNLCRPDQLDIRTTTMALKELQDSIIYEVIKKGMLIKKGVQRISTWRERWFVLTPTHFKYFTGNDEKELKGEAIINPLCKVELSAETQKTSHGRYTFKFKFTTPGRTFEMCAPDLNTRGAWQAAIRTSVEYCKKFKTPQEMAREERRLDREMRRQKAQDDERKRKQSLADIAEAHTQLEAQKKAREAAEALAREEEERRKREEDLVNETRFRLEAEKQAKEEAEARALAEEERWKEQQRMATERQLQLEQERKERVDIEAHLRELAAGREEDQKQLEELLAIREQLLELLEQEKQAKRDEEIVRGLQAKALQEELDKRELLEKMQEELQQHLREEQEKRHGLETTWKQQEEALQREQYKLEQIEKERHKMEQDFKDATVKLEEARRLKFEMEERFKQKKPAILTRLAAHLPDDEKFKLVTHRGLGAFVKADFSRKDSNSRDLESPPFSPTNKDTDSGVPSEGSITPEMEKKQQEEVFMEQAETDSEMEEDQAESTYENMEFVARQTSELELEEKRRCSGVDSLENKQESRLEGEKQSENGINNPIYGSTGEVIAEKDLVITRDEEEEAEDDDCDDVVVENKTYNT